MTQTTKNELPTRFDFAATEEKWNQIWLDASYYHPTVDPAKQSYCIAFPPPNVTGSLHMGHAANATVQDVLIRSKRMQGYNALWILGTDHAGIGTQFMVEKQLKQEEQLTRHDLGRAAFLERVWRWKDQYGDQIIHQMKRMGASGDYERARFTMDEGYSDAIRRVFVDWYNDGLIYRAKRLVNWDPVAQTVLSDLEVESKEENGFLWHIRYPLADEPSQGVVVATTRPETMLGDTAVAVHPSDERYKSWIGKMVRLPLTGREVPIVADALLADPEFGSGAVKVTPAHDFNDWECGQRNHLPMIQVIGLDAHMNDQVPAKYQGLTREAARQMVVEDLEAEGALVKTEPHVFQPSRSQRTGVIIEPLPLTQWFVKMKPLAELVLNAIRSGEVRFTPERWGHVTIDWLENVRDWCISRQLWWGHQIPVWYDTQGQVAYVGMDDPTDSTLVRDEDVLDTWFSSALWPFATLGWPQQTPELEHFHPTQVLSTARDILNLWVVRMIFSSVYFMGKIPFTDVLVHATILTKDGKRMSKSKGTGLDPLVMVDQYGADACRNWLAEVAMSGQDVRFSPEKLESSQHFVTKIWNASRFILMNLADYNPDFTPQKEQLQLADRWILSRLHELSKAVTQGVAEYNLFQATRQIYSFVWTEFCDWYVEIAKPRLAGDDRSVVQWVLALGLDSMLRLMHPFMPFVTEELWSSGLKPLNPKLDAPHLIVAAWVYPEQVPYSDPIAENQMEFVMDAIRTIRNLRMEMGVPANKEAEQVYLVTADVAEQALLQQNKVAIQTLGRVKQVDIQSTPPNIPQSSHGVSQSVQVILPMAGLIDIGKEKERLAKELEKLAKEASKMEARLANPQFAEKAPADVVQQVRDQLSELKYQQQTLGERLNGL